eukprot:820530-Pleurochrysis_carterae.AAC.1
MQPNSSCGKQTSCGTPHNLRASSDSLRCRASTQSPSDEVVKTDVARSDVGAIISSVSRSSLLSVDVSSAVKSSNRKARSHSVTNGPSSHGTKRSSSCCADTGPFHAAPPPTRCLSANVNRASSSCARRRLRLRLPAWLCAVSALRGAARSERSSGVGTRGGSAVSHRESSTRPTRVCCTLRSWPSVRTHAAACVRTCAESARTASAAESGKAARMRGVLLLLPSPPPCCSRGATTNSSASSTGRSDAEALQRVGCSAKATSREPRPTCLPTLSG